MADTSDRKDLFFSRGGFVSICFARIFPGSAALDRAASARAGCPSGAGVAEPVCAPQPVQTRCSQKRSITHPDQTLAPQDTQGALKPRQPAKTFSKN